MNNRAAQFEKLATKDGVFDIQKFAELIVTDCVAQCDIAVANASSGYSEDFITGYKLGVGKCYYKIKNLYGMSTA